MPDHAREQDRSRDAQSSRPEQNQCLSEEEKRARAAWRQYVASLPEGGMSVDTMEDLTASQRGYIENLRAVEAANPKAKPNDIAMALSLVLWEGRIWDRDGGAADVATPMGIPLVLDYEGGDGYQDVEVSPEQEAYIHKHREIYDKHYRESGVAHAFPAVAAQAGREGTAAGDYNTHMVTAGGDFIQDVATVIVEQRLDGTFRDAEARDNDRAISIAEQAGSGRPLSDLMLEHFRAENAEQLDQS